jgi:hypothetical protein
MLISKKIQKCFALLKIHCLPIQVLCCLCCGFMTKQILVARHIHVTKSTTKEFDFNFPIRLKCENNLQNKT